MFDYLQRMLVERGMAPHGYCLLWDPALIWTHVISDALIGLAYFSIPLVLVSFLRRRPDVEFGWAGWMFAIFITACGLTHFISILTLWVPAYGIEALVKLATAAASVTTAIALWPLLPRVVALPSPAQLQRANDELSALVVERDRALAALSREAHERAQAEEMLRQSQKLEAVGQLTSGLAHDFNNLLTIILASLDRAKRVEAGRPKLQHYIDNATDGAERAAHLVDQVLSFARKQPMITQPHDVNAIVEGMRELLEHMLGPTIRLTLDLETDLPTVKIDKNQTEAAILNLVANARDAMTDGGDMTIVTRRESGADGADQVAVVLSDTGAGMDATVRERVFEPFFTTKPVGQGTGLGLSQVYGFIKQAGGDVDLESAPGEGTRITLRLPATRSTV